jgi:hypothetical protein
MHRTRWAVVFVLSAACLAGCAQTQEQPVGQEVSPPGFNDIVRQKMIQDNPDALFGTVIAVRPQDRLVNVDGIPADKCRVGDVVAIYEGSQAIVGRIVLLVGSNDHVHVLYEAPGPGQRDPQNGDTVVKLNVRR